MRRSRVLLAGGAGALGVAAAWCWPAPAPLLPAVAPSLGIPCRLSRRSGIAVTFDDGPHPEGTPAVLEALAEAGATRHVLPRRRAGRALAADRRPDRRRGPRDRAARVHPPPPAAPHAVGARPRPRARARRDRRRHRARADLLPASLRRVQRRGAEPRARAGARAAALVALGPRLGEARDARADRATRDAGALGGRRRAAARRRPLQRAGLLEQDGRRAAVGARHRATSGFTFVAASHDV